jgi:hypothetical protein
MGSQDSILVMHSALGDQVHQNGEAMHCELFDSQPHGPTSDGIYT